jgi:signal transduction histidine kinase
MTAVGPTETIRSRVAHADEEHLRAQLHLAGRLGALGSGARDLVELFRALYLETARLMDATVFLFAVFDEASQTVHVVRQMDRGVEHDGGSFPLGKGFTSEVISSGVPKVIRNWSAEGPPIQLLYGTEQQGELVSPQSGCIVPIRSGERILGAISAQSYAPDAYGELQVLSLEAIAAQAATLITHMRRTEEMAAEHERHAQELEAVLAAMSEALVIVDARGAIVRLNRAARELLRLDSTSLVLGQPLERQRLEQWPATARELASALVPLVGSIRTDTGPRDVEIELTAGGRRVLRVGASVLRSAGGAVVGGVIVLHDVTAQRDLERLREDIFAMAWHDMQAPITVIRGNAELLLRQLLNGDRDGERSKKAASLIMRHADGLSQLLTTLFDISCLEAGVFSITRWPIDLVALAHEVAEGIRSTNGHDIQVVASEPVVGEWDEKRVRQVLTNLVANAAKYSPDDSRVVITVAADDTDATVSVSDAGIGFDGTERAQLFRRGFRSESARKVRGHGLGLYLSRGIVTIHGGRMWAESAGRGKGSTFTFSLPLEGIDVTGPQQTAAS